MIDTNLLQEEIEKINKLRKEKYDLTYEKQKHTNEKKYIIQNNISLISKKICAIASPKLRAYECNICKTIDIKQKKSGNRRVYCVNNCQKAGHREISKLHSRKKRVLKKSTCK